ncbi:hypothetical protein JW977_04400 [Candidatus Falkowbacteria bacterium]|nr:hypothetical protein [Candidatus Falkowbacteria bacterium]
MVANTNQRQIVHVRDLFRQAIELIEKGKRSPGQIDELSNFLQYFKDQLRTFIVVADYRQTLAQMIESVGCYFFPEDISVFEGVFPLVGTGRHKEKVVLVPIGKPVTELEALAHLAKRGFEPVGIEYLLAFGELYPYVQEQFPIIAASSTSRDSLGNKYVPCLYKLQGRIFHVLKMGKNVPFRKDSRFLAFQK